MKKLLMVVLTVSTFQRMEKIPNESKIAWSIEISHTRIAYTALNSFKVKVIANNEGEETEPPYLHEIQLFINKKESKAWSLAIGNQKLEREWMNLPPNKEISIELSSIGNSLFQQSGFYNLSFKWKNKIIEKKRIRVDGSS